MPTPIHAATRRLRGHLVKTPMIGGVRLPALPPAPALRVKAECLQTTGSAWYRGYLHYLLQSLGRYKGLVLQGSPRAVLAQAFAAEMHRLPMVAVGEGFPVDLEPLLLATGCEWITTADVDAVARERAESTGFELVAGVEHEAVQHGLATLGLELAAELPADVERVVCTEPLWREALLAGLVAGDREVAVTVLDDLEQPPMEFATAVISGLRLAPDTASLAAMHAVWGEGRPTCVVLS